jgi:hypothetical protein
MPWNLSYQLFAGWQIQSLSRKQSRPKNQDRTDKRQNILLSHGKTIANPPPFALYVTVTFRLYWEGREEVFVSEE